VLCDHGAMMGVQIPAASQSTSAHEYGPSISSATKCAELLIVV
jgi:hypothetical protein